MLWFKEKAIFEYLFNKGRIFLLRTSELREGTQEFRSSYNLGFKRQVSCSKVGEFEYPKDKEILVRYSKLSGFSSLEEFLSIFDELPNKLYHIVLLNWNPKTDPIKK